MSVQIIHRGYSLPDRIWEPPFVSACLSFETEPLINISSDDEARN